MNRPRGLAHSTILGVATLPPNAVSTIFWRGLRRHAGPTRQLCRFITAYPMGHSCLLNRDRRAARASRRPPTPLRAAPAATGSRGPMLSVRWRAPSTRRDPSTRHRAAVHVGNRPVTRRRRLVEHLRDPLLRRLRIGCLSKEAVQRSQGRKQGGVRIINRFPRSSAAMLSRNHTSYLANRLMATGILRGGMHAFASHAW